MLAQTPWRLAAVLSMFLGATALAVALEALPSAALGIAATVAGHGVLLGTAFAWAGVPQSETRIMLALIGAGALAATLHPLGGLAYLAPTLRLARLASGGRLRRLGLGLPYPRGALVLGALAGAFLGVHLMVSAALTVGYRPRLDLEAYGAWVLFDLGAHVPATEAFFRGALFDRLQRRWSLGVATLVASAATVIRYLVDPLLPHVAELVVGAVLYISLLSAASCWLYWRYGALAPGMAAALVFFAAFRILAVP